MEREIKAKSIDFGTGKLYYIIEPDSTILLTELMQALQNAAMVVPLHDIIKSINNRTNTTSRF